MKIRLEKEALEEKLLSKYAVLSKDTKGRVIFEEKCDIRTEFERDRDRIIHSKSFRRLKHKTQVFIAPEGDHFRTRLTHTLEVSQIARTLARALLLNENLVEAIALGHDLGHTPFGHSGERVLDSLNPYGFKHNEQSGRIIKYIEHRDTGKRLNLTQEVIEGIINHSGKNKSETLEGQVVRLADRIAYINHDIDDALRAKIISEEDLPKDCIQVLGNSHGKRIDTMIKDIINNSYNKKEIKMSEIIDSKTNKLRRFMFDHVYIDSIAKSEEEKVEYIITEIYNHYKKNIDLLPNEYKEPYKDLEDDPIENRICDYIAGMTDRYVLSVFSDIFLPKAWKIKD